MQPGGIPFPEWIDPIIVQIGPLAIRWYGVAYVVGILLGYVLLRALVARPALFPPGKRPDAAALEDFILRAALGAIIGGRLGFVLFYAPGYFITRPHEILFVWQGGMAFHGGLIGMTVAGWAFARQRGLPFLTLMDLVSTAAPIGLFFGRIANFINGELWGRVTDVPWRIVFPGAGPIGRHPSQLYEAALEGLVLFAILLAAALGGAYKRPGFVAGLFLIGYAIFRAIGEHFREPDASEVVTSWLSMGQLFSMGMFLAGVVVIALSKRRA
jgi:phosphatidylglycerol---prolipoprotein diacylglyceryl transferase